MNELKKFLKSYDRLCRKAEQIREDIDLLEAEAIGAGGFDYAKDRVIGSASPDAPFVSRILSVYEKYQELQLIEKQTEERFVLLGSLIRQVGGREGWLLKKLYLERKSWNDIFDHGSVPERTLYDLHKRAIKKFEKVAEKSIQLQ